MFEREKYILEKLISKANLETLLRGVNYFIAGGACTSVFSGSQVNDLDIYFFTEEDCGKAQDQLVIESSIFRTENAWSFKNNGVKVQYICKVVGSETEILKNFDFTVNECAYNPKVKDFVMNEDYFLYDLCSKRLRYNINGKYPVASLWRVNKYIKKGFSLPAIESIKLALRINNLHITTYKDLKEQLEGIDTLFLKDLTDKFLENPDKEFQFNEALELMNKVLEEKLTLTGDEDENI